MDINNKVTIITGASSGIGEATARLFSKKGAKVVLAARSKVKLKKLEKELPQSYAIATDMTNTDDIKMMVAETINHYGRVDILINNAGRGYDSLVENIKAKPFHKIFDLNLFGPIVAMQQVIPVMRKQGGGTIVNISSGTALMVLPGMSAYASLKQALGKLSLTAREELKTDNIVVSVVYPYITATDFEKNTFREFVENSGNMEEQEDYELPPADPPELVAEKIHEVIKNGNAELYVHEWLGKDRIQ